MATVKKAQKGKKVTPTYKNLRMGVNNEYYQVTGESRSNIKPTSRDSARYRAGFEKGLKGMKGDFNEGNIEKMGRWEGQNVGKKPVTKNKMGGKVKKAQTGITESGPLSKVPAAGAMRKSKMKERSADGNYMQKTVTRETPAGSKTSTKVRRTAQGILRGAPKMNKYKMGGTLAPTKKSVGKTIGKLNKAKSGMKMSKMSKKK